MHVVSGKLRKPPFIKDNCGQDCQSKMYAIELTEVTKDWQTQEKSYTNYKAMFFAKTDGAKSFYDKAFAEGSFVVVAAEKIKPEIFNADSGKQYITLNLYDAKLESCLPVEDGQQGGSGYQKPQQQTQQRAQQQKPQYDEPSIDYDDSIPFAQHWKQFGKKSLHSI